MTPAGSWTYGPGDSFVMPAGFPGLWEVLEPAQKFYAIYEPAAGLTHRGAPRCGCRAAPRTVQLRRR